MSLGRASGPWLLESSACYMLTLQKRPVSFPPSSCRWPGRAELPILAQCASFLYSPGGPENSALAGSIDAPLSSCGGA